MRGSGFTVWPVSSQSSRTAVSVMGSPDSLLQTGSSHVPWANLAPWLRWRSTTLLVALALAVDDDGSDQQGHGIEGRLEGFGLVIGGRLSHSDSLA